MNALAKHPRANVLGVGIDVVNMDQALKRIEDDLRDGRKGYVCLCSVHGVMEARRTPDLARILAGAALVAPDGMPNVWMGQLQGHTRMQRVAGPDLMLEVMRREEFRGVTHFLCGGKPGVAQELRKSLQERYPWVKIAGIYTPPFGPMSEDQERELIQAVKSTRADIVWVGISTPKQERFMERYVGLLDSTLMFGVGAAFDFHTGKINDCAPWIKNAGLQWVHRLVQNPKHLWKRYLRNNPAFLLHSLMQLSHLKSYPPYSEDRLPGEIPPSIGTNIGSASQ